MAGRHLSLQGVSQQSLRPAFASPRPRALTYRPQPRARNAAVRCSTDARLAGVVSSQRHEKEAILLQRYKAHDAAVTATLVLHDKCTPNAPILDQPFEFASPILLILRWLAGGTKEIVTASLDKSMALWRLQVITRCFCFCFCFKFTNCTALPWIFTTRRAFITC